MRTSTAPSARGAGVPARLGVSRSGSTSRSRRPTDLRVMPPSDRSDPAAPLRHDVRTLGHLLGETLIEQEGRGFFDLEERIRALAKRGRDATGDARAEARSGLREAFAGARRRGGRAGRARVRALLPAREPGGAASPRPTRARARSRRRGRTRVARGAVARARAAGASRGTRGAARRRQHRARADGAPHGGATPDGARQAPGDRRAPRAAGSSHACPRGGARAARARCARK